jgi:N-acetylneuraminate synthase
MSNAHNGDLGRALAIIEAAKDAGVDAIKTQAYTAAELVQLRGDGPAPEPWGSQGWTMAALYAKAQTPLKWFPKLVQKCEDVGLPWFSSVFGTGSLVLLEALDCPRYKLASLDYGKRALLNAVRETGKPLIRSCNRDMAKVTGDTWLYCPPGYPQPNAKLGQIRAGRYGGYSYHGTDPLVPVLAVAYGAKLVEFHVQLDDEPSELEANVSLTISQTADMVAMIRRAEKAVA